MLTFRVQFHRMRKILLLVLLFISPLLRRGAGGEAFAQTNVYHPFPDSNAHWNIWFNANCFSNGMANEEYSIVISGDTIINSLTYHKLSVPDVVSYSTGTCTGWQTAGYKGAIRQEISNRKVYIIPPVGTEQLLYDFTLQVGDTVKGYIAPANPPPDKIQKIDSILIGNSYRKRWIANSFFNFPLIEGVGFMYGLVQRSPGNIIDETSFEVTCFKQNGNTLYANASTTCALLLTGIEKNSEKEFSFSVSPNPSTGIFTLTSSEQFQFSVLDIFGREVYQSPNHPITQSTTVDLSSQAKGIYIIRAKIKEGIVSKKIILQ